MHSVNYSISNGFIYICYILDTMPQRPLVGFCFAIWYRYPPKDTFFFFLKTQSVFLFTNIRITLSKIVVNSILNAMVNLAIEEFT